MEQNENNKSNGRWKLFLVLAVCAAPMIASYFTYYVIKPGAKNNYGTLLDPRLYPLPKLDAINYAGKAQELSSLQGKWIMLQVDAAACAESCQKKLYDMRQLRTAQGKEQDRIERAWLVIDDGSIDEKLLPGIAGTHILKVNRAALEKWLPIEQGGSLQEHIYLIDPLGNLMMRYPKNADANKVKKDLSRLLKASAIG